MAKFKSSRANGKSDASVLLELFGAGIAGQAYTFAELIAALESGSTRKFTVSAVRRVAMNIYKRLLREQSRALHSVRGVGYRLAMAQEHNRLALARKTRSDRQFAAAIETLKSVRWGDLDPESRKAHEGTLMLYSALESNQRAMESRLQKVESAVDRLLQIGK